jgi:hypothetical protein
MQGSSTHPTRPPRAAQAGVAGVPGSGGWWRWLALLVTLVVSPAVAQEALRQSLAGQAAMQARSQAAQSIGYYNIRLGDLTTRFSAATGVQYNDNIHLAKNHREGDFIFTPSLNTQIHYPLTENNSLDLSINGGYSVYAKNSDMSQYFINPGSGLLYNFFIGDFVINLHERLTVTQNGYQNAAANGGGNNASLNNDVGATVTWDLNQVILTANYDHANYMALGSDVNYPDSASDNLSLSAGVRIRPELLAGLEAGGSAITYDQSGNNSYPDSKQWSAGVFGQWQVSQLMSVSLHGGLTELIPDTSSNTNLNSSSQSGMYFALALSHEVNEQVGYTLSASRSQTLQSYGQPYTTYRVALTPNWRILNRISLGTPLWWERGEQFYYQANKYDQYGAGISLSRQITERLSGSFNYQYVQEDSDYGSSYIVNTISLNFSYQF